MAKNRLGLSIVGGALKAARCATLWINARNLASKDEHERALPLVLQIYRELEVEGPSELAPIKTNLLFALINTKVGDYQTAMKAAAVAKGQLDSGNRTYRPEDHKYLSAYTDMTIDICRNPMGWEIHKYIKTKERFFEVNLSDVKQSIRDDFPIFLS